MFGQELRTPVDLMFGPPPQPECWGQAFAPGVPQAVEPLAWVWRSPAAAQQCRMPSRGREVVLHQDRLAPYQPLAQAAAEVAGESPRPLSPRDSLSAPGRGRMRDEHRHI
ncbi:hypothetical protein AAFF_G00050750 [Aldrovandia affinis]|uniref:Uncharacterized protein n=1 Tax=Aldrovandia affinis TaxID=143900 RepID=A0AAD7T4R7_9TELE|nr:hypothetical protein AAFF_G00050750 [Aldrovandia affinis]